MFSSLLTLESRIHITLSELIVIETGFFCISSERVYLNLASISLSKESCLVGDTSSP